ncbi:hypothetical protein OF376_00050 [Ureaplasma miroungigenitalium]|uniref:Uncharacterized protein n=1 Tax=Ureaplasma miroungigenitalium TaxID=1042321 RepID=A0ABT3BM60_9BACT|nr:hypothetical protein [Ureaplasma miroungigenitalium]MCV3728181.1 hypothetical protein [Ureaplasma miroungigenitalium]
MRNLLLLHNLAINEHARNNELKSRWSVKKIISYSLLVLYFIISVAVLFTLHKYFFHTPKAMDIGHLLSYNNSFMYFKNVAFITQGTILLICQFFSLFFIYKIINFNSFDIKKSWWAITAYLSIFVISIGLYFGFSIHNWNDVFYTSFLVLIITITHLMVFIFIKSKIYSIDLTFNFKKIFYFIAYAAFIIFVCIGVGLLAGFSFNNEAFNLLKANKNAINNEYVSNNLYEFFHNLHVILNNPGYATLLFFIICLLTANLACIVLVFILNFKKYRNQSHENTPILSFCGVILLSVFLFFSTISFNQNKLNIYSTFDIVETLDLLYINLFFSILFISAFCFVIFYAKTKNKLKDKLLDLYIIYLITHWMLSYLLVANQTNEAQNFYIIWLTCVVSIINFIILISRMPLVKRYQRYRLNMHLLFIITILILNALNTWFKRYNNDIFNDYNLSLWNMTFIPYLIYALTSTIIRGSIYINWVIKVKNTKTLKV